MHQITNNNSQLTGNGVSLIILTKDSPQHLDNLLSSFFAVNTHKPVELIIIDHSSGQITNNNSQLTDSANSQLTTKNIISKHVATTFIRHLKRGRNYSFSESCNFAAARAKHPYLLFLNDDIIYTDDVLGKAVEMLEKDGKDSVNVEIGSKPHTIYRKQKFQPFANDQSIAVPSQPPVNRKISHVIFWKQNDSTLYGRRHEMVAKYLASREDTDKVLVFDAPISKDKLASLSRDDGLTQNRLVAERTSNKVVGLLDGDGLLYRVFIHDKKKSESVNAEYIKYISQTLAQEGIDPVSAVFWMYPKVDGAEAIIDHFQPACVVTDIVDDHRAWPDVSEAKKKQLTTHYKDVLSRSQFAMCNCASVQDAMREFFPDIQLVPNACDPNPPAQPVQHPLYARLAKKARPVVGFIGNLEKKIDQPLLEALAQALPDVDIVLIGSTHMNPDILTLDKYPNVHFPGVVPYEQAGTWIKLFDVALVPHKNMDLTRNMNPLKVYSYLSWNIPVVSMEIPNLDASSGMVFVARTHNGFIQQVRDLLDKKIAVPDITAWQGANSWLARFNKSLNSILDYAYHKNSKYKEIDRGNDTEINHDIVLTIVHDLQHNRVMLNIDEKIKELYALKDYHAIAYLYLNYLNKNISITSKIAYRIADALYKTRNYREVAFFAKYQTKNNPALLTSSFKNFAILFIKSLLRTNAHKEATFYLEKFSKEKVISEDITLLMHAEIDLNSSPENSVRLMKIFFQEIFGDHEAFVLALRASYLARKTPEFLVLPLKNYLATITLKSIKHYALEACLWTMLHKHSKALNILNEHYSYSKVAEINLLNTNQGLCIDNIAIQPESNINTPNSTKTENDELVSVIIPAYNCIKHIKTTINSILSQSHKNIEIVVVDDCSNDNLKKLILSEQISGKNIVFVEKPINSGPFLSRNIGILAAKGKYITFIDSDDWMHQDRIAEHLRVLKENTGSVATISKWIRIDNNGVVKVEKWNQIEHMNLSSLMIKKVVFEKIGYFNNVRIAADNEFMSRLWMLSDNKNEIIIIDKLLTIGRDWEGSLTRNSTTGFNESGFSTLRYNYWQTWQKRHRVATISKKYDAIKTSLYQSSEDSSSPLEISIDNNTIINVLTFSTVYYYKGQKIISEKLYKYTKDPVLSKLIQKYATDISNNIFLLNAKRQFPELVKFITNFTHNLPSFLNSLLIDKDYGKIIISAFIKCNMSSMLNNYFEINCKLYKFNNILMQQAIFFYVANDPFFAINIARNYVNPKELNISEINLCIHSLYIIKNENKSIFDECIKIVELILTHRGYINLNGGYDKSLSQTKLITISSFYSVAGEHKKSIEIINFCFLKWAIELISVLNSNIPLNSCNIESICEKHKSNNDTLVSIILTTYNDTNTLPYALKSIRMQSWENLDIIVIDDCSEDDTFVAIKDQISVDKRIRYFKNSINIGLFPTRNIGIILSKGNFITFHDSDDWSHPRKIELQIAPFLNDPSIQLTTSQMVRIDESGCLVPSRWSGLLALNPNSMMLRRDTFDKIGYFDSLRASADSEMLARVHAVYGKEAIKEIKVLLTFMALWSGSLTQASRFGFDKNGVSDIRTTYWNAWSLWHDDAVKIKAMPYIPFPMEKRPFQAPKVLVSNYKDILSVLHSHNIIPTENTMKKCNLTLQSLITNDTVLYHGNLYDGEPQLSSEIKDFIGLSLDPKHDKEFKHDITKPLPLEDNSVNAFQSQDVLEHIPVSIVPSVLDEIYRVLVKGGFLRLSLPDYNSPFLRKRTVYDSEGHALADLAMGNKVTTTGFSNPVNVKITGKPGDAHLWLPTYFQVLELILQSKIRFCDSIFFIHYWKDKNQYIMNDFDNSVFYVNRCPPNDMRADGKPISIIVDFIK